MVEFPVEFTVGAMKSELALVVGDAVIVDEGLLMDDVLRKNDPKGRRNVHGIAMYLKYM